FEGKANDGFLVGYAAHSKAYRVYNLSSKKVEETLNLRYLEDKPNVQEHEAHSAAAKYGFEFSNETAEMLHQADIKTCRNLVLAARDPAGSIVSTGGVPAASIPAGSVPASHVPASSIPA
nr:ribonuclease H-like domain-containing protein [Tanacetum cinerariifolium]